MRFSSVVDSRVRILGESYERAFGMVAKDGGGNLDWIMDGEG